MIAGVFPHNNTLRHFQQGCKYIGAGFTVLTAEADHGNVHDVPEEVLAGMRAAWEPLDLD